MRIGGPLISPQGIKLSPDLEKATSTQKSDGPNFQDMLEQKLEQVDQLQKSADQSMMDVSTGKSRNIHEAVLAMEMADTSLKLLVTVRNKALEAYQEIMRIQV